MQWAGLGVHGAAGLNIRLAGPVSALAEYKLTYAKPEITIGGGTGRMTARDAPVCVRPDVRARAEEIDSRTI
jgi:hypothetical protein